MKAFARLIGRIAPVRPCVVQDWIKNVPGPTVRCCIFEDPSLMALGFTPTGTVLAVCVVQH